MNTYPDTVTPEERIKLKWQQAQLEAEITECFHTLMATEKALLIYGAFALAIFCS